MEQTGAYSKNKRLFRRRKSVIREASAAASERGSHAVAWELLRWLNIARAIVAGLMITLDFSRSLPGSIGVGAPALFLWTAVVWFGFSVVVSFAVEKRQPGLNMQTAVQLGGDIGAITLLLYASGGAASGLGELLLVPMAAGALILSLRFALGFAALATLAILLQETFADLTIGASGDGGYVQAGLLGIVFFAIVALSSKLAERLRESELLSAQRDVDLANLAALNDYIIQHLRAGVLVVDGNDNIRLANPAAAGALGIVTTTGDALPLSVAAPRLKTLLAEWRDAPFATNNATLKTPDDTVFIPRFHRLGATPAAGTLVYLEDATDSAEQVRQIKLAGLGRLTASIAHEIRNPLGAIGHANQLMGESDTLSKEERRLVEIINEHTGRVNGIVENVLKLSRGGAVNVEEVALEEWVRQFAAEFSEQHSLHDEDVRVTVHPGRAPLRARVDAGQLRQVVRNLAENALRYGVPKDIPRYGDRHLIEFRIGVRPFRSQPYLEVLDHGPGVPAEAAEQIFEPFYTSSSLGTGLGLFISRELCECNRATLTYHARSAGGSCFRITFANPESWIV
ncbi:MAG TPA: ATP-binding protein [Gammaproteobacteria bacterium]|nr:ATP-binding protein [Gammaproteobacteria bacterium]